MERIAKVAPENVWYQQYVLTDDRLNDDLLARADAAGYGALLVTVDVPRNGRRLRNLRNGFSLPLKTTPKLALDLASHPQWFLASARAGMPRLGNMERYAPPNSPALEVARIFTTQGGGRLDWSVMARIRDRWPRRMVIKGLMAAEDAMKAREIGVDAVMVSNHGGRELEGSIATIEALPAIRAAVGPDFPVLIDSGMGSGEHILKALAAGATFVLVGRCAMFGVGAAGPDGAKMVIDILRAEMLDVAAHLGVVSMAELSPAYLRYPPANG